MPLMDHGGRPPNGDAWSRDAALQAFRAAFFPWVLQGAVMARERSSEIAPSLTHSQTDNESRLPAIVRSVP